MRLKEDTVAGEKKPDPKQAAQAARASGGRASGGRGAAQGTRTGVVQGMDAQNNALLKGILEAIQGLQAQQAQQAQQAAQAAPSSMFLTPEQKALIESAIANRRDMDEVKQMILRFKMLNELNDPESELYKSLSDGSMEKYLAEQEQKKKDDADAQKALNQQELEDRIRRYATPTWLKAVQIAANVGGNIASAVGNNSQSYRNSLAQALMNAANMGTPGLSAQRAAMYGDPRANTGAITAAQALKQQHIGNRNKIIGDTINNIVQGLAGGFTSEHLQQRQLRTLLEEHPPGYYYQTGYQMWKNANNIGNAVH